MDALADILARYGLYLAAVAGLAISFVASAVETGSYRLNRIRLRLRADGGDHRAATLLRLLGDLPGLIISILIVNNVGNYLLTAAVTALVAGWVAGGDVAVQLTATAVATPLLFVFCEVLPKNVFAFAPGERMCRLARPIRAVYWGLYAVGLVPVLKGISTLVLRIARRRGAASPFTPRQRLRALIREGLAEGVITGYQDELAEKVLALRDRTVGDVMIAMRHVAAVPVDVTEARFARELERHSYSRLPVYEKHRGNVVGIVHINDVLARDGFDVAAAMHRDVVRLPAATTVAAAMVRMRRARAAMAVVADDRDRAVGIVTIKDLVEEIVGDLAAW